MKNRIIRNLLVGAVVTGAFNAHAVPAKPGVLTVTDADGCELRVRLYGDESFHQYFTEDGYPVFERDGNLYYGDVDSHGIVSVSDIQATEVSMRGPEALAYLSGIDMDGLGQRVMSRASQFIRKAPYSGYEVDASASAKTKSMSRGGVNDGPPYERGYGLFPELRFPAYGDQKAIVILVEYQDVKFNQNYDAADYFTRMLNEDGFSDYGATGCAAEYFRYNSCDSFRPEFDVYGPVTLSQKMSYYGGNNSKGNDLRPAEMIMEACELLDDTVDFSEYDRNGDGIVDNIFVFYAGRGENAGGMKDTIWPHSWNLVAAGYPAVYMDGVRIHTYGCTNEWQQSRPDGVGTFIHEFSHVIGLPDLYATTRSDPFTPGSWSVLDYGPYNNDGMTPPNYGAFERYALGWMKPREIDKPISAILPPIDSNVAGVIRTSSEKEFFLVENRQQTGWDTYIPGHGMLVWHIDYDESIWRRNVVNNDAAHQYVDLEEADGIQTYATQAGDAFPGYYRKTEFTAETSPAMKTWSGESVSFPLIGITENEGMISFDVCGGGEEAVPAVPEVTAVDSSTSGFTITWNPVEGCDAIVNVYTLAQAGNGSRAAVDPVYVAGFHDRNVGGASSVEISGLAPSSTYYYTVAMLNGWQISEPSVEKFVETAPLTLEDCSVVALDATAVGEDSFTANWDALEGADEYLISVYEKTRLENEAETCDFSEFENGHDPAGWSSEKGKIYDNRAFSGAAAPSLQLGNEAEFLSPEYDDYISSLSFWHRGSNTDSDAKLVVFGVSDKGKRQVFTSDVNKIVGGTVVDVNEFPEGTRQIAIMFVKKTGGFVTIDDVTVHHGPLYSRESLPGLADFNAGSALTYKVSGLKPGADYSYTVRAVGGELYSGESREVSVRTLSPGGAGNIEASGAFSIIADGLWLRASSSDEILIYDATGAEVARSRGDVKLPCAGFYVVTVPSRGYTSKMIVR